MKFHTIKNRKCYLKYLDHANGTLFSNSLYQLCYIRDSNTVKDTSFSVLKKDIS